MAFAYTKLMQAMVAAGVVTDPYFNLVTLLLPGDGTNGAQNNTFLDSSSNNFTITRNGNTTQGTFSPFSQTGWGNYFGATGNYLSIPYSSSFNLTGDFTVECWINPGNLPSSTGVAPQAYERIFSFGTFDAANSFGLEINSNDASTVRKFVSWYNGTSYALSSNNAVSPGNWYHVALVRSGTTITFYLNGVSTGTITGASAAINTSQAFYIASLHAFESDSAAAFNGYISNFRLVKGTAVYTSNFTPSTTPLTAITNTVLLTCQSNRFIDNSSSPATITINGTPSVQAFSPFAPTAAYSASTNGGSGYFDGTGDYLSVSRNTAFIPTTGDFTIEAWVYPTTSGTSKLICGLIEAGDNADWTFFIYTDNTIGFFAGSTLTDTFGPVVTVNQWNHVAMSRTGSTLYRCVNGTATTVTFTSNLDNGRTYPLTIGADQNGDELNLTGWIGGVRIIKGTALYTSTTYTVPTAPFTNVTNTGFLANFTNAGITDATAKNDLETVGNAQISTTQSKFGGSSMYFDGTGDYLSATPKIQSNAMQGGNATIEMWVYSSNSSSSLKCLIDTRSGQGTDTGYGIYQIANNVVIYGNGVKGNAAGQLAGNTWTHLAVTRANTTNYVFIGGTLYNTFTYGNTLTSSNVTIGSDVAASNAFTGYIDDLRITNGFARYTANFTPTTTTFPLS